MCKTTKETEWIFCDLYSEKYVNLTSSIISITITNESSQLSDKSIVVEFMPKPCIFKQFYVVFIENDGRMLWISTTNSCNVSSISTVHPLVTLSSVDYMEFKQLCDAKLAKLKAGCHIHSSWSPNPILSQINSFHVLNPVQVRVYLTPHVITYQPE